MGPDSARKSAGSLNLIRRIWENLFKKRTRFWILLPFLRSARMKRKPGQQSGGQKFWSQLEGFIRILPKNLSAQKQSRGITCWQQADGVKRERVAFSGLRARTMSCRMAMLFLYNTDENVKPRQSIDWRGLRLGENIRGFRRFLKAASCFSGFFFFLAN